MKLYSETIYRKLPTIQLHTKENNDNRKKHNKIKNKKPTQNKKKTKQKLESWTCTCIKMECEMWTNRDLQLQLFLFISNKKKCFFLLAFDALGLSLTYFQKRFIVSLCVCMCVAFSALCLMFLVFDAFLPFYCYLFHCLLIISMHIYALSSCKSNKNALFD